MGPPETLWCSKLPRTDRENLKGVPAVVGCQQHWQKSTMCAPEGAWALQLAAVKVESTSIKQLWNGNLGKPSHPVPWGEGACLPGRSRCSEEAVQCLWFGRIAARSHDWLWFSERITYCVYLPRDICWPGFKKAVSTQTSLRGMGARCLMTENLKSSFFKHQNYHTGDASASRGRIWSRHGTAEKSQLAHWADVVCQH